MKRAPESIAVRPKVDWKDLKKGVDYWLTYDFWPHGGTKVRLKKFVPAKELVSGLRGTAAIVKSENDREFVLLPGNEAFSVDPTLPLEESE